MDCAAVKPRMEALVSGSLPESERTLAEQHIAMCEGCRLELELVRAIGSQEKPAAAAGSKDDWTLDRIFGAEGQGAAAPSSPEPAKAEPEPGPEPASSPFASSDPEPPARPHPALVPSTDDAEEDADTEKPHTGRKAVEATWSFEPADATSEVKPPEESLFFAAEALNRTRGSERRPSNARVFLWGLGGVVGVGLLAFSAWFVLHMGPAEEPMHTRPAPMTGTPSGTTEEPDNAPPEMMQQPDDGSIQHESGEPPDNTAQTKPAATPRVNASTTPPPMQLAPAPSPKPAATSNPKTPTTSNVATKSAPRQGDPFASQTNSKGVAGPTLAPGASPSGSTTRASKSGPKVDAMGDPIPDDEDDSTTGFDSSNDFTVRATAKPAAPAKTTGRGSSMWKNYTPAPKPEETTAPPAEEALPPGSPLEKLHDETVAAQEKGDVLELRRLRTQWKAMIPKIVGPDRARAKREYADCLWSIQVITGKNQDQKDTLAAYREYLLGAPAGGADSRSVSRLRQLEDALSEHR